MKVLVTGGAGFIGSHVVNLLGQAGHDIVVVDDLSTGVKEAILYGKHILENIANTESMRQIFAREKFEACLHFAGSIIVPESVTDPIKYYDNNTQNSFNLIRLCHEFGVNRFIFSSTAAVYGMAPNGKCSEESTLGPINPYGRSKLMTEWMLEDIAKATDFNYIALRYFNVAGANNEGKLGQRGPNSTHLLKVACETATGKRPEMCIFGEDYDTPDGTCIRDYIHIDDLAQAHVDALNYLERNQQSQVLNCGYGHGYSVKEVVSMVKEVTGVDFKVNKAGRRAGDAPLLISVADRIRDVLGWEPKYDDLKLIVRTAYEWEKKLG
jgi:UDP-glucose 4-epimerase